MSDDDSRGPRAPIPLQRRRPTRVPVMPDSDAADAPPPPPAPLPIPPIQVGDDGWSAIWAQRAQAWDWAKEHSRTTLTIALLLLLLAATFWAVESISGIGRDLSHASVSVPGVVAAAPTDTAAPSGPSAPATATILAPATAAPTATPSGPADVILQGVVTIIDWNSGSVSGYVRPVGCGSGATSCHCTNGSGSDGSWFAISLPPSGSTNLPCLVDFGRQGYAPPYPTQLPPGGFNGSGQVISTFGATPAPSSPVLTWTNHTAFVEGG